ncbi:MAG TPA: hypothetical protein VI911_07580 [Patescibacteria group bacterium]|nr:hypothetical protein [Patescibacteria group bacterium]
MCSIEKCTCLDKNDLSKQITHHVNKHGTWSYIPPCYFRLKDHNDKKFSFEIYFPDGYDTFLGLTAIKHISTKLDKQEA